MDKPPRTLSKKVAWLQSKLPNLLSSSTASARTQEQYHFILTTLSHCAGPLQSQQANIEISYSAAHSILGLPSPSRRTPESLFMQYEPLESHDYLN